MSTMDIMIMVSAYLKIEKPSLIGNSTSRQYYIEWDDKLTDKKEN